MTTINPPGERLRSKIDVPTKRFLFGVEMLLLKHLIFGTTGTSSLLPSNFFNSRLLCCDETFFSFLDFIQEDPAREKSIQGL